MLKLWINREEIKKILKELDEGKAIELDGGIRIHFEGV